MYISNLKSIISKIGVLFLSVLVLFSSFGFTVSTHLCGGEKIKSAVGFVKTDLTCGMNKTTNHCPQKNQLHSTCCQNIFEYHHIEDNVKKERTEIFVPDFTRNFNQVELKSRLRVALNRTYFNDFSPPLIVLDITLVHQSFLI